MKKLITIIALLTFNFQLLTFNCCAQLLNGGFEDWSPQYTYENPDHWETMNVLSLLSNPLSTFKATGIDKHSGNYALKLKTISLTNNPVPQTFSDTIGFAFTGKINTSPPSMILGIPYSGHPEKLEFWSKYIPVDNDSASISLVFRKWNGTSSDTIADAYIKIGATPTYSLFQIYIGYHSLAFPDTLILSFASSYKSLARPGSTLFIDDVALTGWVGIDESHTCGTNKVQLFPNPAKDNLNILAQIEEADNLQVFDSSAKLAGVYKIHNYHSNINTALFAEGVYFYYIRNDKNAILTTGKFTVSK